MPVYHLKLIFREQKRKKKKNREHIIQYEVFSVY